MLSKGLRDEEQRRTNAIIDSLIAMTLVPDPDEGSEIEKQLNKLGMTYSDLLRFKDEELHHHLGKLNFTWENYERFGDLLLKWGNEGGIPDFKQKAKGIYAYIQSESKVFSYELMLKMSSLKE